MSRLLVATAVEAEREAIAAGLPARSEHVSIAAVGVGPAAAAAGAMRLLTQAEARGTPYTWIISAGIGGGFPGRAEVGTLVVATRSVAADLGADGPDGFVPLDELGFGPTVAAVDAELLARLREALPEAATGAVLTVSTVTGTAPQALALAGRYRDAAAEGMEGFGVACAASLAGIGFAELRAVSNPVGPRDRAAWRIQDALAALTAAGSALLG